MLLQTMKPNVAFFYRRQLAGGDFTLEANTDTAPEAGHFYLLQGGAVLLCTDDFTAAEAAYRVLCREHWGRQLTSEARSHRMAGAWGLLSDEPAHVGALAVMDRDGLPADRDRLRKLEQRRRHELAKQARFAGRKKK